MRSEDWLYLETDDACAICGTRGRRVLTIHHMDGDRTHNSYDNRIVLCHNCHRGYHERGGVTKAQVVARKRQLMIRTLTQYGVNALKIAYRSKSGDVSGMPFQLHHLIQLGYLKQGQAWMIHGEYPAMAQFTLTPAGRDIVERWLK